jgi:hypothetical protein
MAVMPELKVTVRYHTGLAGSQRRRRERVAAFYYAEDAARFVGGQDGYTVTGRRGLVLWTEGEEELSAFESYDRAASIMLDRAEGKAIRQ